MQSIICLDVDLVASLPAVYAHDTSTASDIFVFICVWTKSSKNKKRKSQVYSAVVRLPAGTSCCGTEEGGVQTGRALVATQTESYNTLYFVLPDTFEPSYWLPWGPD